jgi:hypothetical protein
MVAASPEPVMLSSYGDEDFPFAAPCVAHVRNP